MHQASDVFKLAMAGLAAALVQLLLLSGSPVFAQDELVDLLRLDTTVVELAATEDVPLDVVYGFGGLTVAPEQLVVRLPAGEASGNAVVRIEILASTLSATAGFQSLRVERLQTTGHGGAVDYDSAYARQGRPRSVALRAVGAGPPGTSRHAVCVQGVAGGGLQGPGATEGIGRRVAERERESLVRRRAGRATG